MSHEQEIEQLRAENARLTTALVEAIASKEKLERKVTKLEHSVEELVRKVYGRSSERFDPAQVLLFAEEDQADLPAPPHVEEAPDGEAAPAGAQKQGKKKKGHGWGKLSEKLRREEVFINPTKDELHCDLCGGDRTSIGSPEITERLDYRPASVVVVQTIRHRFRCAKCQDGTITAPLPPPPIQEVTRGRAEAGMLAYVAVSKFNDHLPLNRKRSVMAV